MAKNLDQILTSYGAVGVKVEHPDNPRSGDPCRVGSLVGVALVDEQFGYDPGGSREMTGFHINKPYDPINANRYMNGETPVSFQQNIWFMHVFNSDGSITVTPGTRLYYYDSGYYADNRDWHIIADPGGASAVVGILMRESIGPYTGKRVPVMLTPGATI